MAKSFILVAGICKHICDKFSCLNGSFKKPGFYCWKSVISISVFGWKTSIECGREDH